ncbi:MAG: Lrp/AsnC family transcriptional regulator, partial [Nocardioidaceae bacterium]
MTRGLDALDVSLIELFTVEPRIGVLEASRRLGVARGTVQARLDRLDRDGVISSWAPTVDPASLGYAVTAFLTLEIRQDVGHQQVAQHLVQIPEVIEAYTITGTGDLWCRCVARSNSDLQRVIDLVGAFEPIVRTSTVIALATQVSHRTGPLLAAQAAGPATPGPART